MTIRAAISLALLSVGAASVAPAQVVRGVLVSAATNEPVPYGTVIGPDSAARFTDAQGQFSLGLLTTGAHRLRARMLGYSPLDTTVTVDDRRAPIVLKIRPVAIRLVTIPVTARRNQGCVATGFESTKDSQLAAVFAQLNLNVDRYKLLLEKYPFRYRREETEFVRKDYQSTVDDSTVWSDTAEYDSRQRRPYHEGDVVFRDVSQHGQRRLMYLPTFLDLADPAFDAAHCFAYMGQRRGEIRIDFRPADRIAAPDVGGSVYLDAKRYIVRRALFQLTKPNKLDPPIIALTVTTTFREIAPFVPVFGVTETDQPLPAIRTNGLDPTTLAYHPLVLRTVIERDEVIGHEFVADTIGSQTPSPPAAESPPPPPPVATAESIVLSCQAPPSFETADIAIYGTLTADHGLGAHGDKVLAAVRRGFHLPDVVSLPVYGYEFDQKVAPTLTGQVTFSLDGSGHLQDAQISATSLVRSVDSILIGAVRGADAAHGFPFGAAGHYALSLSSAKPAPGVQSIAFAHVDVPVTRLAHTASLEKDSPAARLPEGNGTFEFVVDEHGKPMPETLRTVSASSGTFARAVANALEILRFDPAVTGTCPVKQVVMQPFQAALRTAPQ